MSLINQMLADLEARRGHHGGVQALDGLQAAAALAPARRHGESGARLIAAAVIGAAATFMVIQHAIPPQPMPRATPRASAALPDLAVLDSLLQPAPRARPVAPVLATPVVAQVAPPTEPALPAPRAARADGAQSPAPLAQDTLASNMSTTAAAAPETAAAIEFQGTLRKEAHKPADEPAQRLREILVRLTAEPQGSALDELAKLAKEQPSLVAAGRAYAEELLRRQETASAEAFLREALAARPGEPGYAQLLAHIDVGRGDVASARATLARAEAGAANDADYLSFLAALDQRLGQHAEAAAHYGRALALDAERGSWWAGLGISLQALGDTPRARQAFQRALADHTLSDTLRHYVTSELSRLAGRD